MLKSFSRPLRVDVCAEFSCTLDTACEILKNVNNAIRRETISVPIVDRVQPKRADSEVIRKRLDTEKSVKCDLRQFRNEAKTTHDDDN